MRSSTLQTKPRVFVCDTLLDPSTFVAGAIAAASAAAAATACSVDDG